MNVEVKENDVTESFILQKLLGRTLPPSGDNNNDNKVIGLGAGAGAVILIILLVLICLCKRKARRRRIRKGRVIPIHTTTTSRPPVYVIPTKVELRTTEDVTRRYQRSASNLSAKSQIYLVPFDVLPPNFDFASREVEVRADYVILKDLALLEKYPSNGVVNEAYETQEAYNPNSIGNGHIPSSHGGERFQKQSPFNPTFY